MIQIDKIWLTDKAVWIRTSDGREAYELFDDYPRLRNASEEERAAYTRDEFGLRWDKLDEDLSFESFFEKKRYTNLYKLFMNHPELNASAVARRMGMQQSLLAAYISGAKRPSAAQEARILRTLKEIGQELCALELV